MKEKITLDREYIIMIFDSFTEQEQDKFICSLIRLCFYGEEVNTGNKYLDLLVKSTYMYCQLKENIEANPMKVTEGGIYGIYYEEQLIYIGKTIRSFNEHLNHMRKKDNTMKLYNNDIIQDLNKVEFKVLFDIKEYKNRYFTEQDILVMELGLIAVNKPVLNQWGVKGEYQFMQ